MPVLVSVPYSYIPQPLIRYVPNYYPHYISQTLKTLVLYFTMKASISCSLLSHMLTVVNTCSSSLLQLLLHSFSPLLLWVQLWASPYVYIVAPSSFSCKAHPESLRRQTISWQTLWQQALSHQTIRKIQDMLETP
jgi:hypothetical protein